MKSLIRSLLLAGLPAGAGAFIGCSDNDDLAAPSEGDGSAECEVVGELCHEVETAAGQDCHERAHSSHGAACHELFSGCVTTCVAEAGSAADAHCAALGELCHPVDDGDGPLHDCHELGHVNDGATCAASFDDCAARCIAAREELEAPPSEGGAGGAPGEHEHAAAGAGGH